MIIPKPLLSEYYKDVEKGKIKTDILPFEVTMHFTATNKNDALKDLDKHLLEYQNEYYIERDEKGYIIAHFWEKDQADLAGKKLRKSQSSFN